MGHTILKLAYYRQNDDTRAKIYREIEPALIISNIGVIEKNSIFIIDRENS